MADAKTVTELLARGDGSAVAIAAPDRAAEEADDDEENPRLAALESTTDGFELAEVDLALRGEGTLMSTAQKGRSDLKLASLRRDRRLVEQARAAAISIVGDDPALTGQPALADELDLIFSDRDEQFLSRG